MKNISFLLLLLICGFFQTSFAGIEVGKPAPEIVLPTNDGANITLSSFKGKVVLVDFWASWCGPCREANEEVIEVYNEYKKLGFEIFSISLDRKKEYWLRAIRDDKLPWKSHVCDMKEWNSPAVLTYNVEALPSTFLIDEHGIVLAIDVDYYDLKKILKKHYNQVSVFPHVAVNQIFFSKESKFELLDMDGKEVIKGSGSKINLENLQVADYEVKIDGRVVHIKKEKPLSEMPYKIEENKVINVNKNKIQFLSIHGTVIEENSNDVIVIQELASEVMFVNFDGYIEKIK